jgi:hypothetical protein
MAALEHNFFSSAKVLATASATNGVATATVAGTTRNKTLVTAFSISANGQPAAAVEATLTIGGQSVLIQIPAAAFAMMFVNFAQAPLEANVAETVSLSVPALGAAIKCTVTLYGKRASV